MEISRLIPALWLLSLMLTASLCENRSTEEEEAAADEESTEFVLELGGDDFDSTIESHALIMVEFYAPWCGHCKSLAPEYEKAAEVLDAIRVPLAKVDATAHPDLASRFGVSGYPTIKVFHDGVAYDYEGPRSASGIVKYMHNENRPDWAPPPESVLVLTADNFTETIDNSALILVEFYAPWCGHCKRLEPEYKKAAADLQSSDIPLAKVDATAEPELAKQYGVEGYPMLFMFRQGVMYPYGGPRERQGIVKYMLEQSRPPSAEISSMKELTAILKADNPPVVLLCAEEMMDRYYELANSGRESFLIFKHTSSAALCSDVGLELGTAGIIMPYFYRSKDEPWLTPIDLTKEVDFPSVLKAARPLVAIRTKPTTDAWYSDYPLLVAYLEIDTSKDGVKDFKFWRDRLLKVARQYPQLTVAMSNEKEYERELTEMGLSDRGEDVSMVIWAGPKEKYLRNEEEDFNEFIEDYLAGELKPFIRSQPKPKKDKSPVVTVVGSTFRDVVLDSSKHVLIEFYAPWCGHCKKLEPEYKELGKKFKKNKDVVIAKFDATANDSPPEFEYTGFPTIFFVRAGSNEVVLYEGERDTKTMASFIKKQLKKKDEL